MHDMIQVYAGYLIRVKKPLLLSLLLLVLVAQISGGIRQTLWSGFPVPPLPSLHSVQVPVSLRDFLLLYGMFSPDFDEDKEGVESIERSYGAAAFAVQSRMEVWAELSDGRFTRLTGADYIPDPRDEAVLLKHKKLEGARFPPDLLAKGDTPETTFGREIQHRYEILNPGKAVTAIYTRSLRWPAGRAANRQNYAGVDHHHFPSRDEFLEEDAWGRPKIVKIWESASQ